MAEKGKLDTVKHFYLALKSRKTFYTLFAQWWYFSDGLTVISYSYGKCELGKIIKNIEHKKYNIVEYLTLFHFDCHVFHRFLYYIQTSVYISILPFMSLED